MDEAGSTSSHEHEPESAAENNNNHYDIYLNRHLIVEPSTIEEPGFREHVNSLRGTMFYVCQGSCLCGTVNNRGKVIYCYGDLVPRHGELFAEGAETPGTTSSKDLLAAQLGIWTFGIIAL
jgi:hypothetical protein